MQNVIMEKLQFVDIVQTLLVPMAYEERKDDG